jgi:hypothetical protein
MPHKLEELRAEAVALSTGIATGMAGVRLVLVWLMGR